MTPREFFAGLAVAVIVLGAWSVYRVMSRRFW